MHAWWFKLVEVSDKIQRRTKLRRLNKTLFCLKYIS